jgi:hypothetical protein
MTRIQAETPWGGMGGKREVHLLLEQRVENPSLFKMICLHPFVKYRAVEPARPAASSAASR